MKVHRLITASMGLTLLLGACSSGSTPSASAPAATTPAATTTAASDAPVASAPAFDSACTPPDEATVTPVTTKAAKPLKIAILGLENNPFWIPVKAGAAKANEELQAVGSKADWIVPAGDTHGSVNFGTAIDAAVVQQYDAIATVAGDAGIVPFINKAVAAGIKVATFNSETSTANDRSFFVGADLYKQGQAAGKAMGDAVGGKGKVAIITGLFSVEAHELRRKGFEDTIKADFPGITILPAVENKDQADAAYSEAQAFMTANPDLAGIYVTAGGPFGAAKAVEEAGQGGKVRIVSFDFVDETMAYVQKGVISGTIGQDPYAQGHDPAIRLYNLSVGGVQPSCGRLLTKSDFVTKDNISDYWTAPAN